MRNELVAGLALLLLEYLMALFSELISLLHVAVGPLLNGAIARFRFSFLLLVASLCILDNVGLRRVSIVDASGVLFWAQILTVKEAAHHVRRCFLNL